MSPIAYLASVRRLGDTPVIETVEHIYERNRREGLAEGERKGLVKGLLFGFGGAALLWAAGRLLRRAR